MTKYEKRGLADCSSGIGNWMSIMHFISFFAIPINLAIMLFAREPTVKIGLEQDLDTITREELSTMNEFLIERAPYWTRTNVFILAVGVEHLIIGLKLVIALLIPDVPKDVKMAEERRAMAENEAAKAIRSIKRNSGARDMEDIIEEKLTVDKVK